MLRTISLPVSSAALSLALAVSAGAQLPAHLTVQGDAPGDWFGFALCDLGDVDGDGISDFAIGAHQNLNGGHSLNPGYVRIVSGATGATIDTLVGDGTNWIDGPDDHFGVSLAAIGDLNGDGVSELLVGAFKDDNLIMNGGMIRVFDGATRQVLFQADGSGWGDRMGISVTGLQDIDGDGVPDYAYGLYKADVHAFNAGAVRVHSGADHSVIGQIDGTVVGGALGWSCADAGDVDNDGVHDIVIGIPGDDASGPWSGAAWVVSGATFAILHVFEGDASNDHFGYSVAGAGDVDGDGHADILVGATQSTFAGHATGPGYARLFSGADGSLLLEVVGEALGDQLGFCVVGLDDIDGDGHADLLVGAPRRVSLGLSPSGLPGYARLISGRDGSLLHTFLGDHPDDQFGASAALLGDLDGDGLFEFAFGAPQDEWGQPNPGYVKVISGGFVTPERHCVSATNSAGPGAVLLTHGTFSVSRNDLVLGVDGAPPNHFGLFIHGALPIQVPFGDGFRCVGGDVRRLGMVSTGPSGSPSLAVDLAALAATPGSILPGDRRSFQFWFRDIPAAQAGFNLSDSLSATFRP